MKSLIVNVTIRKYKKKMDIKLGFIYRYTFLYFKLQIIPKKLIYTNEWFS